MVILITGSRDASPRLLEIARRFVTEHPDNAYIVGEAPGIDATVITACDSIKAAITVCWAYKNLRHQSDQGDNRALDMDYLARDRYMVDLIPDMCIAFWNGTSRGTMYTAKYAKSKGIKTIVVK